MNNENATIGLLGIVSIALALILGLASWEHQLGKVVAICSLTMICIFSAAYIWMAKAEKKIQVAKQKYEDAQSNANKALKTMMELGSETYEGDTISIENPEQENVHGIFEAPSNR